MSIISDLGANGARGCTHHADISPSMDSYIAASSQSESTPTSSISVAWLAVKSRLLTEQPRCKKVAEFGGMKKSWIDIHFHYVHTTGYMHRQMQLHSNS